MRLRLRMWILTVVGCPTASVLPAFGDSVSVSPAVRVAVVGSPHLRNAPDGFDHTWIQPVISRLIELKPTHVMIESLDGEQIADMERRPEVYGDVVARFAGAATEWSAEISQATGIIDADAATTIQSLLGQASGGALRASERKNLIVAFLVRRSPASAFVQWLRLDAPDRRADDILPLRAVEILTGLERAPNEAYALGARLAAAGSLERVHEIDDHTDKDTVASYVDDLQTAMAEDPAWVEVVSNPFLQEIAGLAGTLDGPQSTLAAYRRLNASDYIARDFDVQWKPFLRISTSNEAGRQRFAMWQTRNLLIAARARKAAGDSGDACAVIVIGASHKGFLERYLGELEGVEIIDVDALLEG